MSTPRVPLADPGHACLTVSYGFLPLSTVERPRRRPRCSARGSSGSTASRRRPTRCSSRPTLPAAASTLRASSSSSTTRWRTAHRATLHNAQRYTMRRRRHGACCNGACCNGVCCNAACCNGVCCNTAGCNVARCVLQRRVLQHGRLQRRALQQVPRSSDDYVHRAGRTARIHHDGQTVRCRFHLAPFPLSAAPAWRHSHLALFSFRAIPIEPLPL